MKKEIFYTETGIKGEATIDEKGYCIKYRVLSPIPKTHYYSALNEVGLKAEELFKFKTA